MMPTDVTLFRSEPPEYGNVEDGDPRDGIDEQMPVLGEWFHQF